MRLAARTRITLRLGCSVRRRAFRSVTLALLVLAMIACNGASGPSGEPGLEVGVVPSRVDVARGASATVEVRVERRGGVSGAVDVSPGTTPSGISIDTATIAADATRATLTIGADADLATGERTVSIEATAGDVSRTENLTVRVTAPAPTVTELAVRNTDGSRQLRLGETNRRLIVEGTDLDTVTGAALADLVVTIDGAPEAASVTLNVTIPHGTDPGPRDLVLTTAQGSVTEPAAVEVVPLTAGPDGSDTSGRGTPDDPWRSMGRALQLAQAGDVVLLLAGAYGEAISGESFPTQLLLSGSDGVSNTNVAAGVTIRGEGPGATNLVRESGDGTTLVAFAPEGDLRVESLSVNGFGHALSATTGSIDLHDVHIVGGTNGLRATSQANVRLSGDTRLEDLTRGAIVQGAATLTLDGTVIESATLFGVALTGASQLDANDAVIRRSGYTVRAADTATVRLRDSLLEQPVADAGVGIGVFAEDRASIELHGTTVQRFLGGVVAGGQNLLMRGTTLRDNEIGLFIPDLEPRPTFQPARVYDLGTASDPGNNVLVDNTDYQLSDGRPSNARQAVSISATVIGPSAPTNTVLTGPIDDPPRWVIANDDVEIVFW